MTGIDEKAIEIATRYGGFDAGTTGHRWLAEAIAEALSALSALDVPAHPEGVKALKGMVGLIELILNRADLPTELRFAVANSHRLAAARYYLSSCESATAKAEPLL